MKNKYTFLLLFALVIIGSLAFSVPTFAEDTIHTNFFGDYEDDGQGCGIYIILNLVIDILTYGIAIAAVIGITLSGIIYLTAKGNEQQTIKAKRRITEIVIGIVTYTVLYAGLNFLLPEGKFNSNPQCRPASNSQQNTNQNGEKPNPNNANEPNNNNPNGTNPPNTPNTPNTPDTPNSNNKPSSSSDAKAALNSICKAPTECSWSERIAQTAEVLAWPYGTKKSQYTKTVYGRDKCFTSWSQLKKSAAPTEAFEIAYDQVRPKHWKLCNKKYGNGTALGASCDVFAGTVVTYAGYDKDISYGLYKQTPHLGKSSKWKRVSTPKRGDFCNSKGHSSIYIGDGKVAQAGYGSLKIGGRVWGHVDKGKCSGMRIYRVTK